MKNYKKLLAAFALVLALPSAGAAFETDAKGIRNYLPDESVQEMQLPEAKTADARASIEYHIDTATGLQYTIDSAGNATITGYTGNIPANLTIPAKIEDYTVTAIGYSAFLNCQTLTDVTISPGVIMIKDSAFENCSNLNTISIPESVTAIGLGTVEFKPAFFGCVSLTAINVDENNRVYHDESGVLCRGKTLLQYPLGKTDTTYTVPDEIRKIGNYAFAFPSSYDFGQLGPTYPQSVNCNNVEVIGDNAFRSSGVKTVDLSSGKLTTIGETAFSFSVLESISLPSSVVQVNNAFSHCNSLASITVDSECKNYFDNGGVLYGRNVFYWQTNTSYLTLIQYPAAKTDTSYTIQEGTEYIKEYAFYNNSKLQTIHIPNSVRYIDFGAFVGLDQLQSLTIPASVNKILQYTVQDCGLQTLTFEGLTVLEGKAVADCQSLSSVSLPATTEVIGLISGKVDQLYNPFYNCPNLTNITVSPDNKNYHVENNALLSKDNTKLLSYMTGLSDTAYTVPAEITDIAVGAFHRADKLQSIQADPFNPVFFSEEDALYQGTALAVYPAGRRETDFIVREGTTRIKEAAFSGNPFISKVVFPDSLTTMEASVFEKCTKLTEATLPEHIERIGQNAFFGTLLEKVVLPKSVTYVGIQAFDSCDNLEYIEIKMDADSLIQTSHLIWSWYDANLKYIYVPEDQHNAYKTLFSGGFIPPWTFVQEGEKASQNTLLQNINAALAEGNTVSAANSLQQLTKKESDAVSDEIITQVDALVERNCTITVDTSGVPADVKVTGLRTASGVTEDSNRNHVALTIETVEKPNNGTFLALDCQLKINGTVEQPRSPVLISVPYTEEMKQTENLNVIHIDSHDKTESVRFSTGTDATGADILTFRANGFSNYAIINADIDTDVTQEFGFRDQFTVLLPSNLQEKATLLVAGYDEKGRMIEYRIYENVVTGGTQAIEWETVPAKCRAFLVSKNWKPLEEPAQFNPA